MKRFIFIATALIALASCSDSEFVGENTSQTSQTEQGAIVFGSGTSNITRADFNNAQSADLLGNNFVVEGFKWNGTTEGSDTKDEVFDHYNVNWVTNTENTTTSNTNNWEYVGQTKHSYGPTGSQTIKYWDYAKSQYDFIAFSAGKGNTAAYGTDTYTAGTNVYITEVTPSTMTSSTEGAYTIKGLAAQLAKVYIADLQTIYRDGSSSGDGLGDYNKTVKLTFRPLSAKVRVALYETVPGYSIKDVVFYTSASTAANDGKAYLYTTGETDKFINGGQYTVYFPTTGSGNKNATDYNKAHLSLVNEGSITDTKKEFGTIDADTKALKEVEEAGGGTKTYLGRSSNTATYYGPTTDDAHHYTIVLPNEAGVVLNLMVDYTLVSTDGSGEEINVKKATAQVPAVYATWKSGYAYTYLFKISQNTNGLTNPDISIAGLYPITFDAVVVNDEVDNTQETITTVATPSITTYAKGTVVTTNDEYTTGSNIYVMVENGTYPIAVGNTVNLYTVSQTDGDTDDAITTAAQTINEASVANALIHGTESPTGTWTVTDANKFNLVVTKSALLHDVSKIAATDSPNGNAIPINGAKFTPTAVGTYVIQYAKTVTTAATYKAVSSTNLTEGNTYYTSALGEGQFIAESTESATGKFELDTPAVVSEWAYKIIKVVAP